jgi:pyruvate-formate lyase-activating enzyme
MKDIAPTPLQTLKAAKEIALDEGLRRVYLGNV